jgi:hypothetical protein
MDLLERMHSQKHVWKTIDIVRQIFTEATLDRNFDGEVDVALACEKTLENVSTVLDIEKQIEVENKKCLQEALGSLQSCNRGLDDALAKAKVPGTR